MTNEQTELLLNGMLARISAALEQCHELMPENAAQEDVRIHKGDGSYLDLGICADDHYETMKGRYLALLPMVNLLDEIREEVSWLRSKDSDD